MSRLIVLFFLTGLSWAQTIDEVVIPRKTELFVRLERSISSRTATAGDKFFGQIAVPVTVDDRIIIPTGSYVIGHVETAKEAGRLRGKGTLGLRLDTVILPNGITRELQAILSSAEGYETSPPSEEGQVQAETGQTDVMVEDGAKGASVGAIAGGAARGSLAGMGIGAGIGAATGAVFGALKKNNQVELPRGSSITVVLDNDTRFVKPVAKTEGEKQ